MLTDQELLNLSAAATAAAEDCNVFFGEDTPTPASPRPPAPGIVLTVEGAPEVLVDPGGGGGGGRRHRSQTRSSSRRTARHTSQHRSPSGSRMTSNSKQQQQQNGAQQRLLLSSSGPGVSRSQSMRTARRPQSSDPSHRFRQRIASIPNDMTGGSASSNQSLSLPGQEDGDEDVLRLRNFAVTSKGVVNRGDSFRSKSRSSHSVASVPPTPTHQQRPEEEEEDGGKARTVEDEDAQKEAVTMEECEGAMAAPSQEESETPKSARYRVLVLGPPDVGKTALVNQFMTSEYMCAYDNSQDEENEKSVPVILNGTESELVFFEHQFAGDGNVNFCEAYKADAYLVVYSVTSKRSLHSAKECLRLIHKWDDVQSKALILVGNKTDLARHRVLSTDDGRSVAIEEGSKFIETSAGINHQVDELLVGILSQIRLKLSSKERALQKRESVSLGGSSKLRAGRCSCKAKGILKRILKKACSRSKSCDNLHVL